MAKGKTLTESAKIAGYSCVQGASNALRIARETMPEILDRLGYTDEFAIKEYLAPLLKATKIVYFQNGGIVMDKRVVPDNAVRAAALEMTLRLKNKFPNKIDIEHSGKIAHYVLSETDKREADDTIKKLKAYDAKESENTLVGELVLEEKE